MRKWVTPVLFGTAIGLVGNGRCFDDFALVLTLQDIPQGIILPLAIGAMGVGTFLGGYVSARIVGQKGLLCGFLTGLLYYLVLTGISLAIMHFSPGCIPSSEDGRRFGGSLCWRCSGHKR